MHGMCGNAVKRGVVTGSPTEEKREMEPFFMGFICQRRVCVASERLDVTLLKSGTKIDSRNLASPAGFVTQVV